MALYNPVMRAHAPTRQPRALPPLEREIPLLDDDPIRYHATAQHTARPLISLQVELLQCCRAPIGLHALAAQIGLSPVTVVWLLQGLARHGLIRASREGSAA